MVVEKDRKSFGLIMRNRSRMLNDRLNVSQNPRISGDSGVQGTGNVR